MRTPIVILSGPARCGKDTVAGFLKKHTGAVTLASADPLKELARDLFGFSEAQLYGDKREELIDVANPSWKGKLLPCTPWLKKLGLLGHPRAYDWLVNWAEGIVVQGVASARLVCQTLGTEWGRRLDPDLWIRHSMKLARTKLVMGAPLVVITDGRFRNEVHEVRSAGGSAIRIGCPTAGLSGDAAKHVSETEQSSIPDHWFDFHIHNDKARGLGHLEYSVIRVAEELTMPPRGVGLE
jgi:hypothetical protein